jgi:predicted acylesterase/phospholipase RssA
VLEVCDEVLWVVEPENVQGSWMTLQGITQASPHLTRRLRLVWLRREGESLPVTEFPEAELARPDFKIVVDGPEESPGCLRQQDLQRLVRHLRRASIGLALGGGGARGAAHVGVLRAFQRAGLPVDMIAGTSSGAIVGLSHACGYSTEQMVDVFRKEMAAPRIFRAIPGGRHWYLWWKYRSGGWRRRARHYFGDRTLEQLALPLYLVATDLVTGQCLVRDRGPAGDALLESINVPGLARPILRDGAALVDGGVLNNVPGAVLRSRGAHVVVAVDVAWKIEPRFGGNDPSTPTERMRSPGLVETLLRVIEVQQRALIEADAGATDLVIAPELAKFGFSDYHRAGAIADAGEAAAEKAIPALKRMLAERED